MLDQGIIRRSS
jgi:hypothetical protein